MHNQNVSKLSYYVVQWHEMDGQSIELRDSTLEWLPLESIQFSKSRSPVAIVSQTHDFWGYR